MLVKVRDKAEERGGYKVVEEIDVNTVCTSKILSKKS
jgi:hypothetical protein